MYWLTGFLGLAVAAAPFLLGYSNNQTALWASLAIGAILVITAWFEGTADDNDTWEYWVAGIVGLGAIAAPYALGFNGLVAAVWTFAIVGIGTALAAGVKLFSGKTGYRF